jgi:type III secretion protein J
MVCIAVCGCKEQILHDLSEAEANRIVSRLHSAELTAEKVLQSDGRWAISLPERQASVGLRYLEDHRVVSSQRGETFAFAKGGLIPSREEQRFRYERALAAAIEESLQAVKGVLEARVHLNLPQNEGFFGERGEKAQGSSAVLLLVDDRFNTEERDIARLVAGAAGLQVERISVLRSVTNSVAVRLASAESSHPAAAALPSDETDTREVDTREREPQTYRFEYGVLALGVAGILVLVNSMLRRRVIALNLPWRKVGIVDDEA